MATRATVRHLDRPTEAQKEQLAAEAQLVQQIDNLQRISEQQRNDSLGNQWFRTIRDAYNLTPRGSETPVFRPQMQVPEGQVLGWMEAIDLTDVDPRIFIVKTFESY